MNDPDSESSNIVNWPQQPQAELAKLIERDRPFVDEVRQAIG
jgi:hypothetical protein